MIGLIIVLLLINIVIIVGMDGCTIENRAEIEMLKLNLKLLETKIDILETKIDILEEELFHII